MNNRLRQLGTLLSFTALFVALAYSGTTLRASRRRAIEAARNLQACRAIADRIAALEKAPHHAATGASTAAELTRRVEQAAAHAEISADNLLRIDPQASRRIGDTSYLEQSTFIEIHQATLAQIVSFLKEVTAGADELRVTSIRLTAPRNAVSSNQTSESPESWSAEMTLTVLVFSPPVRRPQR